MPLLGKPDLCFQTACASGSEAGAPLATFILDWKVNGWMSASGVSPKRGYSMIRDGWGELGAPSRSNGKAHKDFMHLNVCGISCNGMMHLEEVDSSWAAQVVTYAWALGSPVGAPAYCGIDQLACKKTSEMPDIRVASFRMGVSKAFQLSLLEKYIYLWGILSLDDSHLMGSFFKHVGYDDAQSRGQCELLMSPSSADTFFNQITSRAY